MTRGRLIWTVALCAVLSLAPPAWGLESYQDHERGWFWYEVEPEPLPEPEALLPEAAAPPVPAQPQDPPALSAAWIRKHLEEFQQRAIDDPTPENVAAFLYVQRAMLDKSQRFAEAVARAVQMDPYLNQNLRRPIAGFGNLAFAREVQAARQEVLAKVAKQAGIFFFFQGACKQCDIQAPVLKSLLDLYGFVVFPVSVDGQPLGNGLFPDYASDRGQAQVLGVVKTPAMFLGRPGSREIVPLGQNTMARDQLEQAILVAAREAGWITQEEFNRTQRMDATLALDLRPPDLPDPGMSPEAVVEYLKSLYRSQGDKL